MKLYHAAPKTTRPDDRDELLIALDDDPELAPYLEAFDRLMEEPRMEQWADKTAWWLRVTGQERRSA